MTLTVRSHIGADDDAFNAIRQREDEDGIRGICLQRNVVPTAALALKTNISSLAPHVLPLTELVRAPARAVGRAVAKLWGCAELAFGWSANGPTGPLADWH